ncbi:FAD binding domain-protein [Achaetomium macrosporum]|uniref:FAD binding domain-protein n=1 Tax=Achaetomium macrosporum TaxID=79813 RepID=A0AAN7C6W8_9PEZI|nr:FAD binding domain-protein [Achaetomium macrosporum]
MTISEGSSQPEFGTPSLNGAAIHDVIIVGTGPCGLAVAARLREQNPAAIFTDEEHQRFHWMRRHGKKMALKHVKSGRISCVTHSSVRGYDIVVVDANHDDWMGRWNQLFQTFDVKHLRSLMFWHLDPNNRDGLLSKAYGERREGELLEIKGCVGKEISKHMKKRRRNYTGGKGDSRVPINERDRNDYFTPSQALFSEHCKDVVAHYSPHRAGLVRKERALDISYASVPGGIRYSRIVVLAVGPGNQPRIPRIPGVISCSDAPALQTSPHACHTMQIRHFPDPVVKQRIASNRHTNILVIGGGLTSAQVSDLAIRKGAGAVWHMMRGPLRVKPFDVDLVWMGKFRNVEQSRFWQADSDEERLRLLKEARGGGSVTPIFHRVLKQHVASDKLRLFENTILQETRFQKEGDEENPSGLWHVKTSPDVEGLPPMDYIYFATGIETDFTTLPYLQSMLESHPIDSHGGFPCLNDDLMWKDDVPLFVAGRLAALKLGPSAPNLGGVRLAAERITWGIEEVMCKASGFDQDRQSWAGARESLMDYATGTGNMFNSLLEAS